MNRERSELAQLALRFGIAIVGAIASLGFVAFVGAIILWSRFEAAQLPADQAVKVQTREDLITVGAIALVLFVLGGLVGVLLLRLLDREGRPGVKSRRGLLGILLLEIAAAFAIEQWDGLEWLPLAIAALAGLTAIGVLSELAETWLRMEPRQPVPKLWRRAGEVFLTGRWGAVRVRLWIGALLLLAAVAVAIWVDPATDRYVIAAALAVAGALTLLLFALSRTAQRWGLALVAFAAATGAAVVLAHENDWVAHVALIALVLAGINLAIARATGAQFLWYGATVFLSVMVFGTAFAFVRGLEDPQGQGVAILRHNDTQPICGLYVSETDDRLYYGRVDLKGTADIRRLRKESGRLLWVPRDRIDAAEIGPLEPLDAAQSTALDLRQEVGLGREPAKRGVEETPVAPRRPPRSPGGADPCGPQPQGVAQGAPSATRELAERFQPRLKLSADDGFWPVSLLTIFDLQQRGQVLCREPACVPVRSAADLPFNGGENQWLEYPGDFDSRGQQRRHVIEALGTQDPYRSAREYYLVTNSRRGTTTVQFWFFYPFNYQPLKAAGLKAGYHEGDFEHVAVLLSRDGRPRMVWMARHDDEGQTFLWNERALERTGEHMNVYPAQGSHASYESCLEQARRRAPFGLINDRPECAGSKQIVLEPGQVPLWDLSRARWACWAGRFGHTRAGISRLEWNLYEGNGPRSPLWQQNYGGEVAEPCAGLTAPLNLVSEGEEPLPSQLSRPLRLRAGKLDPLFDDCADWRRPQPQGAYVTACDPRRLAGWVRGGLGTNTGAGLSVLPPGEQPRGESWPVAAHRNAGSAAFRGWRLLADRAARAEVYASCLVGSRPIEAVFEGVRLTPGRELTLDDSVNGSWRLLDGTEVVATAEPDLSGEADGPNAPKRKPQRTRCA